jgi:hypothetical protein
MIRLSGVPCGIEGHRPFANNAGRLLAVSRSFGKWRTDMNMEATRKLDEGSEVRALTNAELDQVNGGFIFLALGLVAAFEAGFIGGCIAANYSKTGNFWGDI